MESITLVSVSPFQTAYWIGAAAVLGEEERRMEVDHAFDDATVREVRGEDLAIGGDDQQVGLERPQGLERLRQASCCSSSAGGPGGPPQPPALSSGADDCGRWTGPVGLGQEGQDLMRRTEQPLERRRRNSPVATIRSA